MAIYFVTRHPGAAEWASRRGIAAHVIANLDPRILRPGDEVIGALPVHIAAEVWQNGAVYRHLRLDLPAEARGKHLSAEDMEHYGVRIETYYVERRN